jgi:Arc/MetJ-type ribon-helix-helix transcriptional regulator
MRLIPSVQLPGGIFSAYNPGMDRVTLPPELEQFAAEAIGSGRFRDRSALLVAGVDLLQRQEQKRIALPESTGCGVFLPLDTDVAATTPDELTALARRMNATPRKCLQFKTPAEVLQAFVTASATPTIVQGTVSRFG